MANTGALDIRWVRLNWDDNAVVFPRQFRIERKIANQEFEFLVNSNPVQTTKFPNNWTFVDETVSPETEYTYRIRSFNSGGISYWVTSNTVVTPPAPVQFQAIYFVGGQYIEIPDADILSPRNFTVELWVNQPALARGSRNTYLYKNSYGAEHEWNFMEDAVGTQPGDTGIYSYIDRERFSSDARPVPNVWTHIAVTFDSNLNKLEIFVNGVSVGQKTILAEVLNAPGNLYFGKAYGHPNYNSMTGTMDEIRISNLVRYTTDFQPLRRFAPDAFTIALYHFDGSGDFVLDSSGNGNHGTIYGATRVQ
ncbi:hypothetical protein IH970_05220 [candidate division KSB1 bacterium]|nr:hypothetical protein [candidate division KSB1 bacterium]